MAAKGKGKIVKQWSDAIPLQSGELEFAKVPISLTAGDGVFHIPLPQHVVDFFGPSIEDNSGHGSDWKSYKHHDCEVQANTLDGVQSAYQRICRLYRERVRDLVRKKMIVVTFQANVPGRSQWSGLAISSISFAQSPALSLTHEVQWLINDSLYRIRDRGEGEPPQMAYMQKMPTDDPARRSSGSRSLFVLDWTAEREAFFDNMRDNMVRLVELIAQMLLGDTTTNIDRLIASGGGLLSLPAPEAENVR